METGSKSQFLKGSNRNAEISELQIWSATDAIMRVNSCKMLQKYHWISHILYNLHQFAALHFDTLNSCHHWNWSPRSFACPNKNCQKKNNKQKHLHLSWENPFSPPAPCCSGWCFARFPLDVPSPSQRAPWEPTFEASHVPCDVLKKRKSSGWTIGVQLWPDHQRHQSEISGSIYINLMIQTRFHDFSLASTTSSSEDIRSSILLTMMTITPSYPPIPKNIATRASCLEAK